MKKLESVEKDFIEKSDFRVNKVKLKSAVRLLKTKLSPEGWIILVKFMKTAAQGGWNRAYTVGLLANLFSGSCKYESGFSAISAAENGWIRKAGLASYKNKILYDLIGKDLIEKNTKLFPVGGICPHCGNKN